MDPFFPTSASCGVVTDQRVVFDKLSHGGRSSLALIGCEIDYYLDVVRMALKSSAKRSTGTC